MTDHKKKISGLDLPKKDASIWGALSLGKLTLKKKGEIKWYFHMPKYIRIPLCMLVKYLLITDLITDAQCILTRFFSDFGSNTSAIKG